MSMKNETIRHYLSLYAVSFIFIVFGIWEISNPLYWSGFVPSFISKIFSNINLLVQIHGIILAAVGMMFAFDFRTKVASAIGTLVMLDIVFSLVFESGFSSLVVRDFVILLLVASVFFDDYKKKPSQILS